MNVESEYHCLSDFGIQRKQASTCNMNAKETSVSMQTIE